MRGWAAAFLLLGGCAALGGGGPRAPDPAAERGHALAQRMCAACHAVEPGGASPRSAAPPFGSSGLRHTAALEGRLADLTRHGHYEMPPVALRPEDVRDLAAYIESLSSGAQR